MCRMLFSQLLIASAIVVPGVEARAQTSTSTIEQELREQIKEELRQELVEQIKAELKTEMSSEGTAVPGAVQEDTWAEEEWKWEEPAKPELNFVQVDGYFRFRYDLFHNTG